MRNEVVYKARLYQDLSHYVQYCYMRCKMLPDISLYIKTKWSFLCSAMRTDAPDVACANRVMKEGQLLTGMLRIGSDG